MDVGGRTLGADAREVFEEGLYVPMLKLFERGQPNRDLFNSSSKTHARARSSTDGPGGGNEVGGAKLIEFMEEYYMTSLADLSKAIITTSRRCHKAIDEIPDATYQHEIFIDGFDEPIIAIATTIGGPELALISLGPPPDRSRHQCTFVYCVAYTHTL